MQIAAAEVEPLRDERDDIRNAISTMAVMDALGAKYNRKQMLHTLVGYLQKQEASLTPEQVKAMSGG